MDGRNPSDLKFHDHNDVVATSELGDNNPFNSDFAGPDIHSNSMRNYFKAIHVFQIHGQYVTRTSAINPVLQDAQVTQLDYASTGAPSEITFNIEYEKLEYGPQINFKYDEKTASNGNLMNSELSDLLEEVTKAPVFDPGIIPLIP